MSKDPGDFTDRPDDLPRRDREDFERDRDRDRGRDRDWDYNRDPLDVRRRDGGRSFDERYGGNLSGGDLVLCILCPGIACILGIIRALSGNPTGGKMIGVSLIVIVVVTALRVMVTLALQQ